MKWEYKATGALKEKAMNELGQDDWELVAVIGNSNGNTATMFFKRQVKE